MGNKINAFTLVELIIIVAIAGLIAAFTVPTYERNSTQAHIAAAVPMLDGLMHQVLISYATKGSPPLSLDGVSGAAGGSYGSISLGNVTTNLYYTNGSNWTNHGALMVVNLPASVAQGIPGYVQSTTGSDGTYNAIGMGFYDNNGTIMMFCGRPDSSSNLYVPLDYLPPGCNNDNFLSTLTG